MSNDPDWSHYKKSYEVNKARYEKKMKIIEQKEFWFKIFDFIYIFIFKPALFVGTVLLIWWLWQFFDSMKAA